MSKALKRLLPVVAAIAGSALLPGIGTATLGLASGAGGAALGAGLGSAGVNYSQTHNLGNALKAGLISGGGTLAGNIAGNYLAPASQGTIGSALEKAGGIGGAAMNALPAELLNTGLGAAAGSYMGNTLADDYIQSMRMPKEQQPAGEMAFKPQQQAAMGLPDGAKDLANMNPLQQGTSLATKGTYGSGLGAQENQYFLNLANRRLVDSGGNVSDMSSLSPIEMSYLQKLGLGGYNNTTDLLKAISQWKAA